MGFFNLINQLTTTLTGVKLLRFVTSMHVIFSMFGSEITTRVRKLTLSKFSKVCLFMRLERRQDDRQGRAQIKWLFSALKPAEKWKMVFTDQSLGAAATALHDGWALRKTISTVPLNLPRLGTAQNDARRTNVGSRNDPPLDCFVTELRGLRAEAAWWSRMKFHASQTPLHAAPPPTFIDFQYFPRSHFSCHFN